MPESVTEFAGGERVLSGPALRWFATAGERALHGLRLNGMRDPIAEAWVASLSSGWQQMRTSANGSSEVPTEAVLSPSALVDPITTRKAAEMMRCTPRNVLDLRERGALESARKVGGQWQFERHEIAARAARTAI